MSRRWWSLSVALVLPLAVLAAEPWRVHGTDDAVAAYHALERFTFGPTPGAIDRLVDTGIDAWFDEQLRAEMSDPSLSERLAVFESTTMSSQEISLVFKGVGDVRTEAVKAGAMAPEIDERTPKGSRLLGIYMRRRGWRSQHQLVGELMEQKVVRAVHAENQLREVLTEFWFNHFNVSLDKAICRTHVLSFERDVIRPHAMGRFVDLLRAVARHPAMLLYLDNAVSAASIDERRGIDGVSGLRSAGYSTGAELNENYARELLELHTLGVDGGYTQQDVIAVARIFTGWTVLHPTHGAGYFQVDRWEEQRLAAKGVVLDPPFLFDPSIHDYGAKEVMGHRWPPGRGMEEGIEFLNWLAEHPATGMRVAEKLARHFVHDDPDTALVADLAKVYRDTGGDVRAMIRAIYDAPAFWSAEARRAKVKPPFQYGISAVRSLGGDVRNARPLAVEIAKLGHRVYRCEPPTGYPDRGEAWVNVGSLLSRMNFGFLLAFGSVGGIEFTVESPQVESSEILSAWGQRLLSPDSVEGVKGLLQPSLAESDFIARVRDAASQASGSSSAQGGGAMVMDANAHVNARWPKMYGFPVPERWTVSIEGQGALGDEDAMVVGMILGCPEFQRR